ncbi:MAG TPA: LamG-like jellyroll fold domain-containing protein, partial [Flavisolibacter sp.]|nr:LamG-like jellyroll fold domain-containing protein [Flavisolibacter sp.]
STTTALSYTSEATFIGSHFGTAAFFSGAIDEVRIWNSALPRSQLKKNMLKGPATNANGLLAYYTCNNGSGNVLTNVCTNGTGSNGAITGATWVASPVKFGGNALSFDGTDDYISIGKSLLAGSSYTKEAWVYATKSTVLPGNIVSSVGSPFWVSANRLRAGNNNATADVVDNTDFPTNTWVHVAVTYDGTSGAMRLYRNGALVASGMGTTAYANENNYIGAWYNNATPGTESFWGGSIDEVRIWNTVRSQAQIQANMWNELDPANASQTSGLVAYYIFNQGLAAGANAGLTNVVDQMGNLNGSLTNFALTGSTSNFVTQQNTLVVLPVKWLSFTARSQAGKALLDWQTAEETTAVGYTVQHSTNGSQWTNLGIVPANRKSGVNTYLFTHNGLQHGPNLYRLALQDMSGTISFSATRSLNFAVESPAIELLGNSVHNLLTIEVIKACVLSLYDQSGKRVLQQAVKQGLQVIDVSSFATGIYLLNSGEKTEKIVLQ